MTPITKGSRQSLQKSGPLQLVIFALRAVWRYLPPTWRFVVVLDALLIASAIVLLIKLNAL